jgi:hypothetical protein
LAKQTILPGKYLVLREEYLILRAKSTILPAKQPVLRAEGGLFPPQCAAQRQKERALPAPLSRPGQSLSPPHKPPHCPFGAPARLKVGRPFFTAVAFLGRHAQPRLFKTALNGLQISRV